MLVTAAAIPLAPCHIKGGQLLLAHEAMSQERLIQLTPNWRFLPDSNIMDNAAIEADFKEFYHLMNGKPLNEIDEIIYAVCTLCRDHEKAGFIDGAKVGMSLANELNIP